MNDSLLYILALVILVSLTACSGNSRGLTEEEIEISEELESRFKGTATLVYHGDTLLASNEILDYYRKTAYEPIWIRKSELNDKGREFYEMVGDSRDYGLLPEMFRFNMIRQMTDTSLLDAEMMLTNAFFLFATHINVGCIDQNTYHYVWKKDSIDYNLENELDKVKAGESGVDIIKSHQPDFWDYRQLQIGLTSFLDTYPLDTNHYNIPAFREDSAKSYLAAHEALIGHSFIGPAVSNQDSAFLDKLKAFQKINGLIDDGIVGKWTGRALNKSNLDRFYQGALSLEKWRWKRQYPDKYIRVNIPEFALYFVDSSVVRQKHRVVVGAYATQTPEFHATLLRMVTNPFWHVPYSIASTEILHGAKTDSGYFNKRGYEVFQDGEQVNPNSIDWSVVAAGGFNYKVRQNGGRGNSLGRIKFLFPNEHSIFIHDTPSKRLFQNDIRAYSHGCIRLHQPFDLAKAVLTSDKSNIEGITLDGLIRGGIQCVIELDEPFEVYLEYFTATGDSSGNVIFHPDIYSRDTKYIENSYKRFDQYIFTPTPAKSEESS